MSKHETPLTRKYWRSVGGTLIEEFPAVKKSSIKAISNIEFPLNTEIEVTDGSDHAELPKAGSPLSRFMTVRVFKHYRQLRTRHSIIIPKSRN